MQEVKRKCIPRPAWQSFPGHAEAETLDSMNEEGGEQRAQSICACAPALHAAPFFGAAIAAAALAFRLLCTSFLHGATLWSTSTVNQCRSILGEKVWMARAPNYEHRNS